MTSGTPLVVQWLRLCAPNAGGPGSIPGQGTGSHMTQLKIQHATTKTANKFFFFFKEDLHLVLEETKRGWTPSSG